MRHRRPLAAALALLALLALAALLTRDNNNTNTTNNNNLVRALDTLEDEVHREIHQSDLVLQEVREQLHHYQASQDQKEKDKDKQKDVPKFDIILPVLVMACNRITVRRCLDQLIKYRPDKDQFPIIVSQDCNHEQTRDVLESYAQAEDSGISLIFQPDLGEVPVPPREKKFRGYFHIARHYKFALNYLFKEMEHQAVIIVEDDLDIAPDFFEYFLGTYPLLLKDPTLWCVSAWNDNGKPGLVDPQAPSLLHRSDFFPGLGWMLTKQLWDELQPKWPPAYWDDWIRKPEQRLDRACIRPELPRTRTFGKVGVSNGLFFEKHLKMIELSQISVPFTKLNLTYLVKDEYDPVFISTVYSTPLVSVAELKGRGTIASLPPAPVRIAYSNKDQYKRTVKQLGLMDDFRSGVGRTAYRGVVSCFYARRRVFIAPEPPQIAYDPTWS